MMRVLPLLGSFLCAGPAAAQPVERLLDLPPHLGGRSRLEPGVRAQGETQWSGPGGTWWIPNDLSGRPRATVHPSAEGPPGPLVLGGRVGRSLTRFYTTDGTWAGTEVYAEVSGRGGTPMVELDGQAFLLWEGYDRSLALLRTDGERVETLGRIERGPRWLRYSPLYAARGRLWFSLSKEEDRQLMVSDGIEAPRSVAPLPGRIDEVGLVAEVAAELVVHYGGGLYRLAGDALVQVELPWRVDKASVDPRGGLLLILEDGRAQVMARWDGESVAWLGWVGRTLSSRATLMRSGDDFVLANGAQRWLLRPGLGALDLGDVSDLSKTERGWFALQRRTDQASRQYDLIRARLEDGVEVVQAAVSATVSGALAKTPTGFLLSRPGPPAQLEALDVDGQGTGLAVEVPVDGRVTFPALLSGFRADGAPIFDVRGTLRVLDPDTAQPLVDWANSAFAGRDGARSWAFRQRLASAEVWRLEPTPAPLRAFSSAFLFPVGIWKGELVFLRSGGTVRGGLWQTTANGAQRIYQWDVRRSRVYGPNLGPEGPELLLQSIASSGLHHVLVGAEGVRTTTLTEGGRLVPRLIVQGGQRWLVSAEGEDGQYRFRVEALLLPSGERTERYSVLRPDDRIRAGDRHLELAGRLLRWEGSAWRSLDRDVEAWLEGPDGVWLEARARGRLRPSLWWWPNGGELQAVPELFGRRSWALLSGSSAVVLAETLEHGPELFRLDGAELRAMTDLRPGPLRGVERLLGVVQGRPWVLGVDESLRPGLFAVAPDAEVRGPDVPTGPLDPAEGCRSAPAVSMWGVLIAAGLWCSARRRRRL